MFDFLRSLEIDAAARSAKAEAVFDPAPALLSDHFPGETLLPGSWLVEMGAQVAGLLCEEVLRHELGVRRWAILGMIRNASFPRPTPVPARLEIEASLVRREERFGVVRAAIRKDGRVHMRAELVMTLNDGGEEWSRAIRARDERLARILGERRP